MAEKCFALWSLLWLLHKSWLIMKEEYIKIANVTFQDYNKKITTDGHRHLGAVTGSNNNK